MDIGQLREIARQNGSRRTAREAGVSHGTVDKFLAGSHPRFDTFEAICGALGLQVALVPKGERVFQSPNEALRLEAEHEVRRADLVPVPLATASASAGTGLIPIEGEEGFQIGLSERWLRAHGLTPRHVVAVPVIGDSMEREDDGGIPDGSTVLVDTTPDGRELRSGQVYVLTRETEVFLKRIERQLDGTLVMHSDNPRYAPTVVPRKLLDELYVAGQVRHMIRPV